MNKKMMMVALAGLMLHCGAAFGVVSFKVSFIGAPRVFHKASNGVPSFFSEKHKYIYIDGSKTILDLKQVLFNDPITEEERKINNDFSSWKLIRLGRILKNSLTIDQAGIKDGTVFLKVEPTIKKK